MAVGFGFILIRFASRDKHEPSQSGRESRNSRPSAVRKGSGDDVIASLSLSGAPSRTPSGSNPDRGWHQRKNRSPIRGAKAADCASPPSHAEGFSALQRSLERQRSAGQRSALRRPRSRDDDPNHSDGLSLYDYHDDYHVWGSHVITDACLFALPIHELAFPRRCLGGTGARLGCRVWVVAEHSKRFPVPSAARCLFPIPRSGLIAPT